MKIVRAQNVPKSGFHFLECWFINCQISNYFVNISKLKYFVKIGQKVVHAQDIPKSGAMVFRCHFSLDPTHDWQLILGLFMPIVGDSVVLRNTAT